MKKLFIILFMLIGLTGFSQTIYEVFYPGKTITTSALDSVSGSASLYYFSFRNPVSAYAIQLEVNDTIEGDTTYAILQGSNYLGGWTAIDTLTIPDSQATFTVPKVTTGTAAYYGVYRFSISEDSLTEGSLYIYIHYY